MSLVRGMLLLILLSLASAAIVAVVSRTPEALRDAKPSSDAYSPELGATFTDRQIERAAAYRGPAYLGFALTLLIEIAALVFLVRSADRIRTVASGVPWPLHTLAIVAIVAALLWFLSLPLDYVRGFAIGHAWGLSTQSTSGWLVDQLKGLAIAFVTLSIGAIAFYGIVRAAPETWWVWGWLAFTILTALLSFLWPVVIAPVFNKFTPLHDPALEQRIRTLAEDAGVKLDNVLVADASIRTTTENAYVAGIGGTKRMVLFDNLLKGDEDETVFVAAHELGHEVGGHVLKNVGVASIGLLVGFVVLRILSTNQSVLGWVGATSIRDVVLPALLLYLVLASLVVLPVQNAVSRSFEAAADRTALDLTHDPDTAVSLFRRLAFSNLADLKPPGVAVTVLFTHPPIPERIESALAGTRQSP